MKIFFDNCTSPILAEVLHALVKPSGDEASHVRSLNAIGLDASSSDLAWMKALARDGADWIVMTADDRIHRSKAERAAWKAAGLKGYVLARGFQKTPVHQTASTLIWRWPEMRSFISSAARGSMFELPVGRTSGFRPLVA